MMKLDTHVKAAWAALFFYVSLLPISCSSQPQGVPAENIGEPIKIGAIFAETGPASFIGEFQANTVRLLVDRLNKEGGINGQTVELIYRDSGGDPSRALRHAEELLSDGVLGIVGPSTSGSSLAVTELCEQNKTVLISCASADAIVSPGYQYIFKVASGPRMAVQALLETMQEMELTRIAVLLIGSAFSREWAKTAGELAPEIGIELVHEAQYSFFQDDFTEVIEGLRGKNIDGILNIASGPVQAAFTKELRAAGLEMPLFQSTAFNDMYYVHAAGKASEGIIFPASAMVAAEVSPNSESSNSIMKKYKQTYFDYFGDEPNDFGVHAYDALKLLIQSINNAGLDREKIRHELENTVKYEGLGGIYSFSPQNHSGLDDNDIPIFEVKNGRFTAWSGPMKDPAGATGPDPEYEYQPVVAVMDFDIKNMPDSEGALIIDYFTNAIFNTRKFYVVAKDQREKLIREIKFSYSGMAEDSSALELGKMLVAEKIVVGSLGKVESKFLFNIQMIDVETAATVSAVSQSYNSVEDLINGCPQIALELSRDF